MSKVRWPFGAAYVDAAPDLSSAITVDNTKTILDISINAASTLNLTIPDELEAGAELTVKVSQDGTGRNLTLGTGFNADAPDLTGVANDVDVAEYIFDGAEFQAKGNWEKIVDAV